MRMGMERRGRLFKSIYYIWHAVTSTSRQLEVCFIPGREHEDAGRMPYDGNALSKREVRKRWAQFSFE